MATAGFRHTLFSAVPHARTKRSTIQTTSDGWNAPKQRGRRKEHYYHHHQWPLPKACRPCNLTCLWHPIWVKPRKEMRTTFPPSRPNQHSLSLYLTTNGLSVSLSAENACRKVKNNLYNEAGAAQTRNKPALEQLRLCHAQQPLWIICLVKPCRVWGDLTHWETARTLGQEKRKGQLKHQLFLLKIKCCR